MGANDQYAGKRVLVTGADTGIGRGVAKEFAAAGAKVAVHLEQPLDIDYDAKGRRVHHRTGEAHASDLD